MDVQEEGACPRASGTPGLPHPHPQSRHRVWETPKSAPCSKKTVGGGCPSHPLEPSRRPGLGEKGSKGSGDHCKGKPSVAGCWDVDDVQAAWDTGHWTPGALLGCWHRSGGRRGLGAEVTHPTPQTAHPSAKSEQEAAPNCARCGSQTDTHSPTLRFSGTAS